MKRILLALCASVTVMAAPAMAQRVSPMTAGNFGRICSRPAGAQVCDAYITGLADAGALAKVNDRNEGDPNAPAGFCVPQAETGVAMRGKVIAWLKAHQDSLSKPVGEGVFKALHDSYPCSAATGGAK